MKRIVLVLLSLIMTVSMFGCAGEAKDDKEVKDTEEPNAVSAKITDEIETFSEVVMVQITPEWKSGKDYGTHTIDTYTCNNDTELSVQVDKEDKVQEISITNPDASSEDAQNAVTSLVISVLQNSSFDFTDKEMHDVGYGIADEEGMLGTEPYTLEADRFKVDFTSKDADDSETRSILFRIEFK